MPRHYDVNEGPTLTGLRDAWGEWLGTFQWDHYTTLTFEQAPSEVYAQKQYNRWVQRVRQRTQHDVAHFHAVERAPSGFLHIHTLTGGTAEIGGTALVAAWPNGHARSVLYDANRGASYYVTKDVGRLAVHYDIHIPRPKTPSFNRSRKAKIDS